MQERVDYAWSKTLDPNFIYLLQVENGQWTEDRRHNLSYYLCHSWKTGQIVDFSRCGDSKNFYWKSHWDRGFCGISDGWYAHIVSDPRFTQDWKWQIDQCYTLYKGGTRFYGADRLHIGKRAFEWQNA